MSWGYAIKCYRVRPSMPLTQLRLSQKTGIPYGRLIKMESGFTQPNDAEIKKICRTLKVEEDHFRAVARSGSPVVLGVGHDKV